MAFRKVSMYIIALLFDVTMRALPNELRMSLSTRPGVDQSAMKDQYKAPLPRNCCYNLSMPNVFLRC